jgi:multimeric flavodoxin WrbA
MKYLILNGNPEKANKAFDQQLENLYDYLIKKNHKAEIINLRDKEIIHCTGCWSCWVKTPGECIFKDDSKEIREKYIQSDVVIFASPLIMGFISSGMKRLMDKCIPLLHPYIDIVEKEAHHAKRYQEYPLIGLLYEDPVNDPEDVEITNDIFQRFALNFKTRLAFSSAIKSDLSEVLNETLVN